MIKIPLRAAAPIAAATIRVVTIADLSKIWVLVDVYEHQIDWLAEGQSAEIRVPAYPGRVWEGQVEYIYPELDPKSRTLKVRLAFDNPDGLLKANMFAEVVIYGGPKRDTLLIPDEALIATGERTSVIKALGGGRFQPVDVVIGAARAGRVEILSATDEEALEDDPFGNDGLGGGEEDPPPGGDET